MDQFPSIEPILATYCDKKIAESAIIDKRYEALWRELKQYLLNGGKRMRPRLVLLAYQAYKKSSEFNEAIIAVAAAWELLHASVLIHDDIIDRDLIRHGKPNIAGRYQSIYGEVSSSDVSHYSLSAALLGGDLLLMSSYEIINSAKLDSNVKVAAQNYITKAIFTVAGGELIDTDSVLYPIATSNPFSVAKHKTASYSLQLPLQCGGAMAGASSEELDKLSTIGLHAGIAYQLKDDLLGVFGDSSVTGKSNRSDIIEKKQTQLILEAITLSAPSESKSLLELYSLDRLLSEEEAEHVADLIKESGAKERIEHMIDNESTSALAAIDSLSTKSEYKEIFSNLIQSLTTRKY